VDVAGLEPAAPCLQSGKTKSILLVRLALFCVLVPGFGPSLAALFCYWSQDGPKFDTLPDTLPAATGVAVHPCTLALTPCLTPAKSSGSMCQHRYFSASSPCSLSVTCGTGRRGTLRR
jgi:hypothetical protein